MTTLVFNAPRDASAPVREDLTWLTDVPIAEDGSEPRRASLRPYPRHTYTLPVFLHTPEARASLDRLRSTDTIFQVPLWPHVFERPDTEPDGGISSAPGQQLLAMGNNGLFEAVEAFSTWSEAWDLAAPAWTARIASEQRSWEHVNRRDARAQLSFRLTDDFREAVPPYDGPLSGDMPVLTPFTDYADEKTEALELAVAASDNGLVEVYELRHAKRSFAVSFWLITRAQILAFRRFCWAVKGRALPFRWTPPVLDEESTWRLGSDTVSLEYLRPNLAKVSLSLVELEAA